MNIQALRNELLAMAERIEALRMELLVADQMNDYSDRGILQAVVTGLTTADQALLTVVYNAKKLQA